MNFTKLLVLTLDDESTTYGCGECRAFVGIRGEVQKHRYREHHVARAGRRAEAPTVPADLSGMTLGELMEHARNSAAWGELVTELEVQRDDWRERALAAESWKRKATVRLAQIGFTLVEEGD